MSVDVPVIREIVERVCTRPDVRGNCEWDIAEISRGEAEQITAGLAARHWPPDAARLPWVASAYPEP